MRNLKKYLSVLLVVAIIATTMVPVFAADTYSYSAEAQKLNTLGLYAGVSTTTFDPDLGTALDRETGIVMLLRIFGLEATAKAMSDADAAAALAAYTDTKDVSEWALKSVAYAVKNGLVAGTTGTTIGPKEALNGDMYATLVLRQLGYTVGPNDFANATYILADKGGLKITEAIKFDSKDLIKDDLVGITFAALNAKYTTGETVLAALMQDGIVTVVNAVYAGVYTAPATPTPTATPTPVPFAVESVTALNAKQVKVTFNTVVDTTSAQAIGNYQIFNSGSATNLLGVAIAGTGKAANAVLQGDAKSVIITLSSENSLAAANDRLTNVTSAKVVVKKNGVKTTAGEYLAVDYSNASVAVADNAVPTLESVMVIGANSLKLIFSEPVEDVTLGGNDLSIATSNFLVDNGSYSVTAATSSPKERAVYITLGTALSSGTHTIKVNQNSAALDIRDYAGYSFLTQSFSFEYAAVTTAPTVSIDTVTQTSVKLKFSAAVKNVANTNNKYYHSYKIAGSAYEVTGAAATASGADSNGYSDTWTISFAGIALPVSSNIPFYIVNSSTAEEKIVDYYGNTVGDQTLTIPAIVADTTAPSATVTTAIDANDANKTEITVTYSEDIDPAVVSVVSNYVLKNSAGTEQAIAISSAYASKVIKFKTTAAIAGGTYTLQIKNMKDRAPVANTMAATTYSLTISDASATTAAGFYSDTKALIKFNKDMDTTTTSNKANYQLIKDAAGNIVSIASVTVIDASTVILTREGTAADGNDLAVGAKVAMSSGILTASGTSIVATNFLLYTTPAMTADAAPVMANFKDNTYKVKATAKDTIAITFSGLLDVTKFSAGRFHVDNVAGSPLNGASIISTSVDSNTNTVVTIKLDGSLTEAAQIDAGAAKLYLDANAVYSKLGTGNALLALGAGETVTDKIAPTVASRKVSADGTKIAITFNENINAATMSTGSTALNGFSVSDATLTKALLDGDTKTVVLTGTGFTTSTLIGYDKETGGIADAAANAVADFSGATASLDTTVTAPVASAVDGWTATVANPGVITFHASAAVSLEGIKVYYTTVATAAAAPASSVAGTQLVTNVGSGFLTTIADGTIVSDGVADTTGKDIYVRYVDKVGNKSDWVKVN